MIRRVADAAVLLAVVAAIVAVAHGLAPLPWPETLPTDLDTLPGAGWFLGGAVVLLVLAVAATRWSVWACACVLAVAAAVFTSHAAAAAAVLFLVLSCVVLGRGVLRLLGATQVAGSAVEALLTGAGVVGTLIALTAARPLHHFWVYIVLLALPLVLGRKMLREWLATWRTRAAAEAPALSAAILVEALSAGVLLLYVVVALLPEIGHDALAMHLFVPARMAEHHRWSFDAATYVWAVMPMLADWLFAAAYILGGETAARLLNVAFLGTVVALARELVRWCGGGRWAERWTVLVLVSMPLTFTLGSSLFIELIWSSFVLAGLLAVLRAGQPAGGSRALVSAGLFLGFALGAKAVTLTILPVLAALLLLKPRAWWSADAKRPIGLGLALLLALGAPPYVNAWLRTGNPVFPFFNARFRSPLYPAEDFESASVFSQGLHWDFPYSAVFQANRYIEGMTGAGGFHWLLLVAPAVLALLFARQWRALALLAAAVAMMAIAFQSVAYLRYVYPAFVIACAAAGVAVALSDNGWVARLALGVGLAGAVGLNLVFLGAGSPYRDFALTAAARKADREDWLDLRQPMRQAVTLVNVLNRGDAPVAVLATPALGHLAADALMSSWYNFAFERRLLAQDSGPAIAAMMQDLGVEYVLLDAAWPRARQREMVASVTDVVAAFENITVRRWKPQYRFQHELLEDTDFTRGKGWQFLGEAPREPGGAWVTQQTPAMQTVPVKAGRRYLNAVEIACPVPTYARLQVNWSSRTDFLKADIRVVECGPQPSRHAMEVVAPAGATAVTVFASGYGTERVQFRENSFRR
jgi:4-amino-4-deoxy-L-arabinose transferase-like glycosyltransferase